MPLDKVPFEFTHNRQRFAPWLLEDAKALGRVWGGTQRVWLVAFEDSLAGLDAPGWRPRLRLVAQVGQWRLYCNRPEMAAQPAGGGG